jgi:hypothetical protein
MQGRKLSGSEGVQRMLAKNGNYSVAFPYDESRIRRLFAVREKSYVYEKKADVGRKGVLDPTFRPIVPKTPKTSLSE